MELQKDRMRGSCPKKNGKDHIPLREWGVLCLLCIASMSEKYKVCHHVPHTPLALLMTSFTPDLRVTNPATQQTWRACVGQLQWRKWMPPKSQTDFVSGKRAFVHIWASPGCLEVGVGGGAMSPLSLSSLIQDPNGSWACTLALCNWFEGSQDLGRCSSLSLLCPPLSG